MPTIERLHQNTPEWHRWRMQGIGASDAPVIMGETAFKTRRTLWSIKTGRMQEASAGPAARRGRALERFARRAYERRTGIQVEPLCLVHQEFDWMRASLDGLSFDDVNGELLLDLLSAAFGFNNFVAKRRCCPIPEALLGRLAHRTRRVLANLTRGVLVEDAN